MRDLFGSCIGGAREMTSEGDLSEKVTSPSDIQAFFKAQGKTVLTFLGFSGSGYEEPDRMLAVASRELDRFDSRTTIVNSGATPDGIGCLYELAKDRGFMTTGIISSEAIRHRVPLSPFVDHVFFVGDATWGGFLEGSEQLSPTSTAVVTVSDVMVAIGGGRAARDELLAARRWGKDITFIQVDMDHRKAKEKARKKGEPEPTDFRGAASALFAPDAPA